MSHHFKMKSMLRIMLVMVVETSVYLTITDIDRCLFERMITQLDHILKVEPGCSLQNGLFGVTSKSKKK